MKKALSILILLLANVAIMAHTLMPHHHHGKQICFANSHCTCECGEHQLGADNHHHDGSDKSDACRVLQEVVLSKTSDYRYAPEVISLPYLLLAVLPEYQSLDSTQPKTFPLWEFSQPHYLYSSFVASVGGLRAPPVC